MWDWQGREEGRLTRATVPLPIRNKGDEARMACGHVPSRGLWRPIPEGAGDGWVCSMWTGPSRSDPPRKGLCPEPQAQDSQGQHQDAEVGRTELLNFSL